MANVKPIQQSAVLAYSVESGVPKVMMVTSRSRGRWVLPKGHVEEGQTAREAAVHEAYEEAGIAGRIAKSKIGTYCYKKVDHPGGPPYKVKVYPMEVMKMDDAWPEMGERDRVWMDFPTAAKSVEEPELSDLLKEFGEMLSELSAQKS